MTQAPESDCRAGDMSNWALPISGGNTDTAAQPDGPSGFTERGAIVVNGIVRTRAAPAGPHPYLDRFASGMHRPLEGEDIGCNSDHRALFQDWAGTGWLWGLL